MFSVIPYSVGFNDDELADLQRRLSATRWPEAETVDDWSQGIPLSYVRELAHYWENSYDWRSREVLLNQFDHYTAELSGGNANDAGGEPADKLAIHFIHQRSPHESATPLVLTHGWPGSVAEFSNVIRPLTDPTRYGGDAADAFHVVCPSLPGFGFSAKPSRTGWGVERIARAWDELMIGLGYEAYGAQGGDWGAMVTTEIGRLGSGRGGGCAAIHTNMPRGRPDAQALENPTAEERRALERLQYYQDWDSGYSKQQSTRPQTLAYALVDSPVGQMAWIVEKFWSWMDCDGHPENVLSKDQLLDNVMLYWLTKTGGSSGRLYWESFGTFGQGTRVEIPTGVASFPKEIIQAPRRWCEVGYNITHWTDMAKGGHFAALEQPEAFVDDVRKFFRTTMS